MMTGTERGKSERRWGSHFPTKGYATGSNSSDPFLGFQMGLGPSQREETRDKEGGRRARKALLVPRAGSLVNCHRFTPGLATRDANSVGWETRD